MQTLTLYGTEGCHLCEEAEQLLQQWLTHMPGQFELVTVDIVGDDALFERYGVRIPVILHRDSGRELGWPFDIGALDAFLAERRS
jgi:glutaredoxin